MILSRNIPPPHEDGHIQRVVMLTALSISIAIAVALGMLRVSTGISIWWIIVPGYGLGLILTRFCPALFTAIAFDSGGVASGPMATTLLCWGSNRK